MEKKLTISTVEDLLNLLQTLVNGKQELKIIWSNPLDREAILKQELYTNDASLKTTYAHHYIENNQSFTYQLDIDKAYKLIADLLEQYKQTVVYTTIKQYQVLTNKRGKTKIITTHIKGQTLVKKQNKQYLIPTSAEFLTQIGLATTNNLIKAEAQKKYRQINKFVEIIDTTIRQEDREKPMSIYDFGCGKGYLTFGLYHYLSKEKKHDVSITGIDLKASVIETCNIIAKDLDYKTLSFEEGDITNKTIAKCDMLIALHACDIATDIALHKAIVSKAKYIFSSPCCHKEVRKLMKSSDSPMLKHGIIKERQAEMVTDVLRTLLLEQHGYKADIFEFVSAEHTSKNLMIRAVFTGNIKDNTKEIAELKQQYGVEGLQYLEKLLS